MNNRTMAAVVGFFVIAITTLSMALMMFIGDREFSGKEYRRYELLYDSSVKGLSVGAPVTLRGVKIGEVVSVKTKLFVQTRERPQRILNSIIVDLYPEMVVQESPSGKAINDGKLIDQLIDQGLAAKLGLQSILTGMLYVEVDVFGTGEPVSHMVKTDYPQLPTMPNDMEALFKGLEEVNLASMADDLKNILDNLSSLSGDNELAQVAGNVNLALKNINHLSKTMTGSMIIVQKDFSTLSESLNQLALQLSAELPETNEQLKATFVQLQTTMVQIDQTLADVSDTVASDSPLIYQLEQSARDISRASRAIENLSDQLENQPDSILFGRKEGAH